MELNYSAPKTIGEFMLSEAFFRVLSGPVGSGKTTGCMIELLRRACEQAPGDDGIRYTRFGICRQTLSQLKQTVLRDIVFWFNDIAHWKVSENTVYLKFLDVDSEWLLLPLETPEDQRRILSMQLTGGWLSEGIEIDFDLVAPIAGRCGRYPTGKNGVASWHGLICDTNMSTEGTPWHKAMSDPDLDWTVHIQPGGLEPTAENLAYLLQTPETIKLPLDDPRRIAQGRSYYQRLARNRNEPWVRRYVHAKYGPDPTGAAVFGGSFRPSFHCVPSLDPVRGRPLIVGQDLGRDPWSVIMQQDNAGRLLILEEVAAHDIGLIAHIRNALRPALYNSRYSGMPIVIVFDPAGAQKSQYEEINALDVFKREGFSAMGAGANDIDTRLSAVEYWLLQQRMGGPAILFDRGRCPKLVEGMSGMYRYSRTSLDVSKPKPDKNEWSHVADGLQYGCMASQGATAVAIARKLAGRRLATAMGSRGWT
jgi:hypothetical protein